MIASKRAASRIAELLFLYHRGRLLEAEHLCEAILRENPRNFDALHLLGVIALQTNRPQRGVEILRQAVTLNSRNSGAVNNLGNALRVLNRPDEAIDVIDRAVAADARSSELWSGRAAVLNDLGRYQDALASAQKAISLNAKNAEAYNVKGISCRHLNHYQEALDSYSRAIALQPQFADAHFNMGNVLADLAQHEKAIAAYRTAISCNPAFAEAYNSLAISLRHLRRLPEALNALDKAVEIEPRSADAHNDRANVLKDLRHYGDALAAYTRAVSLRPDDAPIYYNIGCLHCTLRSFGTALAAYDDALARNSRFAEAWIGRGQALSGLKRYDEAFAAFDKAISLNPDLVEAWACRGDTFTALRQYDEAYDAYNKALTLSPDVASAWFGRGNVHYQRNLVEQASSDYQQALRCAPDFLSPRIADCLCELQILYERPDDILRRRARYENKLSALSEEVRTAPPQGDLTELLSFGQPFYLAYQGYDDRAPQRVYGSMACSIMERVFACAPLTALAAPNEKIRIGIVSAFFFSHSNWNIPIRGWLSQLNRHRFEIFGYHVGDTKDAQTSIAASMCDRFVHASMDVGKWRKRVLADAPHILIYPGLYMDRISMQLAAQRLAPVQCNSWGHPDTSGLPTIDYYLSSDLMEPSEGAEHYTESLIRLPNLSIYYEPSGRASVPVTRPQLRMREGAVVFWCGQSIYKYLPQYDGVFARIAKSSPNCQFAFIRHFGATEINELFEARLEQAFAGLELRSADHCIFLNRLDESDFSAAMGQCDIFLDSIGWSGCNSTLESLGSDLPIVTLEGPLMRGRHSAAILRMMGVTETTARNIDDYVEIAARLAGDPDERSRVSREIAANKHRVYRDRACIDALEAFLESVGRQRAVMQ